MSKPFLPWKILHWDLSRGLPPLSPEAGCGGFLVVLWAHDLPLGHLDVPSEALPLSAHELSEAVSRAVAPALGYHLWNDGFRPAYPDIRDPVVDESAPDLEALTACETPLACFLSQRRALHGSPGGHQVAGRPVSVIICTRERPADLVRCLESLQRCTPAADEILVVDNAPTTARTREVVEQFPAVRYLVEPRPGLAIARNTGVRHARGEIIAFTDDDVAVHPTWIKCLRQGFDRPEVLALTGLVLPTALETESQWIFEKEFGGFSQGYRSILFDAEFFRRGKRKGVPVWRIGAGANMAFRREAFEQVGLFDERLGAGGAGCSEDSEFWYRLLAAGWMCRYEPSCIVFHSHRAELSALRAQMYQYMRGHVATLLVQAERHRDVGNLYRLFVILPKHYVTRLVSRHTAGSRQYFRMVPSEILGCLAGVGFFLRHPSSRLPVLRSGGQKP